MFDLIAQDRLTDVVGLALVGKLGRVHANDDQLVGVLGFQFFQVRDDVHAVDTAVRPKIQQHDLPFEPSQGERLIGVEPGDAPFEFRGAYSFLCHSVSLLCGLLVHRRGMPQAAAPEKSEAGNYNDQGRDQVYKDAAPFAASRSCCGRRLLRHRGYLLLSGSGPHPRERRAG